MKATYLKRACFGLVTGAALLCATSSQAQTLSTSWTNTFDAVGSEVSYFHWYDLTNCTFGFDGAVNSTLPPVHAGGSLVSTTFWPGYPAGLVIPPSTYRGQDQMVGSFAGGYNYNFTQTIDATKYDSVVFDILVDPTSPTNNLGDMFRLTVGFFRNNYSTYTITNIDIHTAATNGWQRHTCMIDKATAPTPPNALAAGLAFNINCYGGPNGGLMTHTNEITRFWLDNLQLNLSKVPVKPPTLSTIIKSPKAGLNLFSGGPPTDQYQRTNLKLIDTSALGDIANNGPLGVNYNVTISDFPNPVTYGGYQAHIFITTGPGTASALDYNDANLLFLDIKQNADGTGTGTFRYKTNQPAGNSMVYGAGTLGQATAPTVIGTWTLNLSQGTNITVTGPGGTPFQTNISAEAAAIFIAPLSVVFGAQPNQPPNVGQDVILSSISISNADTSSSIVNDNFIADSVLDTLTWSVLTGEPNTLFLFPNDPGQKLIQWTLPDTGFGLQTTTKITNPNSLWTILTGNEATGSPLTTYTIGGNRIALVPSSALGPDVDFFRLFTRNFTKLQVLMPGEVAAPGTPTGKTGTPDAQTVGVPFNVTVNAVNQDWFLAASGNDLVRISSSDVIATLPSDTSLAGGTATVSVTINTAGTFTVTATDVDVPARTANTGSTTQAN